MGLNTPREEAARQAELIDNPVLRGVVQKSLRQDSTMNEMVKAFHKLYELPIVSPSKATMNFDHISKERLAMRFGLIVEEFMELCEAMDIRADVRFLYQDEEECWVHSGRNITPKEHQDITDTELHAIVRKRCIEAIEQTDERSLPDIADACFDLKYVIIGFEYETGIDPQFCAVEGHAANMTKLGEAGQVLRREDGKVMKGPNFVAPNMAHVLKSWGMRGV